MGNNSLPYEIVHCSSWDEEHDPEQLVQNNPGNQLEPLSIKCKGWQTPKCPEYPQDLIIHLLSGSCRISKIQILSHHFKIAARIDVYMGVLKDPRDILEDIIPDSPPADDEDNMLIEFKRLGHVCFDNNARAQFRARELKSIKINSDAEYIRLVVRNCHRNGLNEYNQVGILALNIIGQPLHLLDKNDIVSTSSSSQKIRRPFDDNSILSSSTRRTSVSSNHSQTNKLSPTSQEIELQHWTQVLISAEQEAVQSESYQTAKTYKYLSDKLDRFGKILSDLEIGKRHAVETKDYDEAEKIKDDMKEIKQAAEAMLKHANIRITEDGRIIPIGATTLVEDDELDQLIDEVQEEFKPISQSYHNVAQHEVIPDNIIPIQDPDSIPEPIMEEERIPYTLPIQLFGEDTVACVLSVKVKCRKRGLLHIQKQIESFHELILKNQFHEFSMIILDNLIQVEEEEYDDDDMDEMSKSIAYFMNATLMLVLEAVMDSREPIVTLAIETWEQLNEFYQSTGKSATRWIMDWTERAFSCLLKRTSDSNVKIKQTACSLVLILVQTQPLYQTFYVSKPDRVIHHHKEAKARIELVQATVTELGIQVDEQQESCNKKVCLSNLMEFVVAYLNHGHEDVRQTAVKLVVTISDLIGFSLVSSFIDENLRISLAETVKKLIDKDPYYYYEKKATTTNEKKTKETLKELRALTVIKPEKKTTASKSNPKKTATATVSKPIKNEKKPLKSNTTSLKKSTTNSTTKPTTKSAPNSTTRSAANNATKSTTNSTIKPTIRSNSKPTTKESDANNENSICIFCDEVNPEFNEDTLIKHYYNNCPVLTNCPMCHIITEISTLNEHMLADCEKKHLIKECTRCHQAIPVEQWLQHTLKQVCQDNSDSNKVHCPLCSTNIEPPDELGWRNHLLTGEGCPNLKKSRRPSKK